MGVVNLTEDSFSDGGRFLAPAEAVAAARRMIDDGADIIDIGAESTRPGALPVPEALEWARLEPVLSVLVPLGCPISVDTRRPSVMTRAIASGAAIINDVGGFSDPAAVDAVAAAEAGVVVMHMQAIRRRCSRTRSIADVVAEVRQFLRDRSATLIERGCRDGADLRRSGLRFRQDARAQPGAAGAARGAAELRRAGAGRAVAQIDDRAADRPAGRARGSVRASAAALVAVAHGARIVRVHDVAATVDALAVWNAVAAQAGGGD